MARWASLPDLSPARLDLDVYRGDTLTVRVQVRAHGRPVDISVMEDGSGWLFEGHVKDRVDGSLLGEWDIEVVSPVLGVLRLQLSADLTQVLPDAAVWDLQSVDRAGRVRTLLRGGIAAVPDVTRLDSLRRGVRGGRGGR